MITTFIVLAVVFALACHNDSEYRGIMGNVSIVFLILAIVYTNR